MPSATAQALARQQAILDADQSAVSKLYACRLCSKDHPLRLCRKFLNFNVERRMRAVLLHRYCPNCLAHDHYNRGCTSSLRCRICDEDHHTLLHMSTRLCSTVAKSAQRPKEPTATHSRSHRRSTKSESSRKVGSRTFQSRVAAKAASKSSRNSSVRTFQSEAAATSRNRSRHSTPPARRSKQPTKKVSTSTSRKQQPSRSSTSAVPALTSLLQHDSITLSPTATLRLLVGERGIKVRALLDQCAGPNKISRRIVDKYGIPTVSGGGQTVCRALFRARAGPEKFFRAVLQVVDDVPYRTPVREVSRSLRDQFSNMVLADEDFYRPGPIDVLLGGEAFPRLLLDGVMRTPGRPIAQNSVFGWVLSGTCPE